MDLARHHAGRALQLAGEHGFPFWALYGSMIDAAAEIVLGNLEAVHKLREGAGHWKGAGAALGRCWHLTFIAMALREMGSHQEALALLDEALEFCEANDSRFFEPEVRRQRAAVLLDPANPRRDVDAGRQECQNARAVAVKYGADWWLVASSMKLTGLDRSLADGQTDLRAVLRRLPASSDEPPLVREARLSLESEPSSSLLLA